uniref:Uncharacterized protein n=1 Tax=Ursus maritimus TaxID=29073 RepID=A0A452UVF3_URSMA
GHARPPPAPQPAQHPGLRRQVEPPAQLLRLFYCTVLVCSKEIAALTDFSAESSSRDVTSSWRSWPQHVWVPQTQAAPHWSLPHTFEQNK